MASFSTAGEALQWVLGRHGPAQLLPWRQDFNISGISERGKGVKVTQAWKRSSWKIKTLFILVSLYLLYVLLGFFVAPGLVRDNARDALAELTGREVVISEVKINPLALSATVNGFAINDEQTDVLLGFNQLYVNFELSSLFRWSWHFSQVDLDGLTVRGQRNPGSVFNFDDVLAHIDSQLTDSAEDVEPEPAPEDAGALPNISVGALALTNGDLRYTEAAGKEPHQLVLPVAFTVTNFSTVAKGENQNGYAIRLEGPDGGAFDWDGRFEFSPFLAQGRLSIEKVDLVSLAKLAQGEVRFTVPSGELDLQTDYLFTTEPGTRVVVSNGELTLRELQIQKPGEDAPSVSVPALTVTGIAVDSEKQEITLPEVSLSQPAVNAVLDADGLDLATLFLPVDPEEAEQRKQEVKEKAQEAAERIKEAETVWVTNLGTLKVDGNTFRFTDRTLNPPQTVSLTDGEFTLKNLILGEEATFTWEGKAQIQEQGALTHSGEGQLAPLSVTAKAALAGLPLAPLSPWLEREAPLKVASGQLDLDLQSAVKGDGPDITVNGSASMAGFNLLEGGRPLIKVNRVQVSKLSLDTAAQRVRVGEIGLTGMDMLHQVDAQGRDASTRIEAAMPSGSGSSSASSSSSSKPWQVTVDRVRLIGSQVRHEDLSLSPNFRIGLYQLSGTVSNLDTRPGSTARLDLNAQVDRYAPFSIKGRLSPEPLSTDMVVSLNNYEMTSLTPYTGLYLGYKVEKGQLGVDTEVTVEKNHLNSVSDILADQFYLGEKVPSDEAVRAPVKLGLSVLRSRSGEITLPVKMSGDLDDPSFSVSGMILKVLTNIVVKAATAPFSVLAGLAGGENLETIVFDPGTAEVGPQTSSSLQALAKVLTEKPHLHIGLVGTVSAEDRTALADQTIGDDVAGDDWPGIDAAVLEKKWRRKLIRRYESDYDRDVETLVSAPLPEDDDERDSVLARSAWDAMVTAESASVDKAQLVQLARLRSENAKAALVQQFQIELSRVYLKESKVDGAVTGLTLTLEK